MTGSGSRIATSVRRGATLVAVALWAGTTVATALCAEVAFPAKPVQLVLPFPAGTQVDVAMRAIAEPLSRSLGSPCW